MTDSTPAPSPAPAETSNTPSADDSLKAIASEFTVEEQANQFTATPSVPAPSPVPTPAYAPTAQPQYVPDPVTDQEGYKAWVVAQGQRYQQLDTTLREVSSKISAFDQRMQQQKIDADVDRAINIVNSKWKVDKDLAEVHLEHEYRKNPSFKRIWDNRDRNPEAFERALKVVADKRAAMFQVRQDPQIAENVRAAQSSQRTMATTKQQSQTDEAAKLSGPEFDAFWSRLISGG